LGCEYAQCPGAMGTAQHDLNGHRPVPWAGARLLPACTAQSQTRGDSETDLAVNAYVLPEQPGQHVPVDRGEQSGPRRLAEHFLAGRQGGRSHRPGRGRRRERLLLNDENPIRPAQDPATEVVQV
jgi:hypothetical protein